MSDTLIKICGVTREDQAQAIAAMGADLIGINFWPRSKRFLPVENAGWLSKVPSSTRLIGVFVNPDLEYLSKIGDLGALQGIQLHGDETPQFCAEVEAAFGIPVVKAFQIKDEAMLDPISAFPTKDVLLDAYHPQERGGLGETFPWDLAVTFLNRHPDRRLYLAGGLNPDNVAAAVSGVHPYAVDVASGVEGDQPGVKDLDKVAAFIKAVRAAM